MYNFGREITKYTVIYGVYIYIYGPGQPYICPRLATGINIRCIYGVFGREFTKYTAIYGVYIRFWLALHPMHQIGNRHKYTVYVRYFWQGNHQIYGHIRCIYTVLANPIHMCQFGNRHK
jgi:hypothetical protein